MLEKEQRLLSVYSIFAGYLPALHTVQSDQVLPCAVYQ